MNSSTLVPSISDRLHKYCFISGIALFALAFHSLHAEDKSVDVKPGDEKTVNFTTPPEGADHQLDINDAAQGMEFGKAKIVPEDTADGT